MVDGVVHMHAEALYHLHIGASCESGRQSSGYAATTACCRQNEHGAGNDAESSCEFHMEGRHGTAPFRTTELSTEILM